MALFNFDRSYTLTIETPPKFVIPPKEEPPIVEETTSFFDVDDFREVLVSNALVFTDLQIKVQVSFNEQSSGSDPVKAEIKIYNASEENRNKITKLNSKVILTAGYKDEQSIIFTGQAFESKTVKEGEDIITTLRCKDGWTPLDSVRYSKSFKKGQSYDVVFRDIVKEFKDVGINEGSIVLNPPSGVPFQVLDPPAQVIMDKGWAYTGYLRQALEDLCKEFNYTWQIIHSKLFIYPISYSEMFGQVEVDSASVLSIREREDGTTSSSSNTVPTGLEVKVFLNGDVDQSKQLVIKNTDDSVFNLEKFSGTYRIVDVKHELDYEGTAWYTTIKCDGIKEG